MLKMQDESGHTVTIHDEMRSQFEARGFKLLGDAPPPAEGALVGTAVRVHNDEEAPVGPDHKPQMIQATDGHQIVWVDAAHTPRFASFMKRGFLPIPPQAEGQSRAEYEAQVEQIKKDALAKSQG